MLLYFQKIRDVAELAVMKYTFDPDIKVSKKYINVLILVVMIALF